MKKVITITLIFLLIPIVLSSHEDQESQNEQNDCGFFCKIGNFFKRMANPTEEIANEEDNLNNIKEETPPKEKLEKEATQEIQEIVIPTTKEEAIENQIEIISEKADLKVEDFNSKNLCTIKFNKEKVIPGEDAKATYTFDESLKGKSVAYACDQYERNSLGDSGDESWVGKVSDSLTYKQFCDYGRVTTPTIYFWFVFDPVTDENYCISSVTVIPQMGDEGECHSDEVVQEMKEECTKKGTQSYSILDGDNCETIYCGAVSCTSEDSLVRAEQNCLAEGNTPTRYSQIVEGLDWPCAQVRCSKCTPEVELTKIADECTNQGDGYDSRYETDFETDCKYVVCDNPNSNTQEEAEIPTPIAGGVIKETKENKFTQWIKDLF